MRPKPNYLKTDYSSIPDMFFKNAERLGHKVFEYYKDGKEWKKSTYSETAENVLKVASSLLSSGVRKGDRVAIISSPRREWVYCDIAIQSIGAITVPIYPNITAGQTEYILKDSIPKMIFAENISIAKNKLKSQKQRVVVFKHGEEKSENWTYFNSFLNEGGDSKEILKKLKDITYNDVATIVYTSGTTGEAKGVIQTHGNIISMLDSVSQIIRVLEDDVVFIWLPLAHTFGRLAEFYSIYNGIAMAYAEGIAKFLDNIKEIKPTIFPSVPRIYEKAYETIIERSRKNKISEILFAHSVDVGKKVEKMRLERELIPFSLRIKHKILDRIVLSKIRDAFGGRIRFCISGGAPLSKDLAEFFSGIGILVLEGYGLTETCPVVTVNRIDKYKFGSVGLPLPGVSVKIADDGEILLKAPQVAHKGYYKKTEITNEMFDEDGWLKTGDIGYIDEDGFVFITGRKKEIIVNSFGKNIAPSPIETELCKHPLINSAFVYGDSKPYVVAILALNKTESEKIQKEKLRFEVKKIVDRVNENLSDFEKIRRFCIVKDEWTTETGELTPTLKIKRDALYEKYKNEIESMYGKL